MANQTASLQLCIACAATSSLVAAVSCALITMEHSTTVEPPPPVAPVTIINEPQTQGTSAGSPASAAEPLPSVAPPLPPVEQAERAVSVPVPDQQTSNKPFDPIEALKLGGLRLANIIRKPAGTAGQLQEQQPGGGAPGDGAVVARIKATAAGLSAKAKEQGSRFYQASVTTAASTAEGIKRLALGEPLQALCRSEFQVHPCPQLVLASCTALVSGGGITTERIFKHNPPPELVDRLAAAAGSLSLLPPGASPHAIAGLLKRFLLGLPEPLLTYRLLPQWVAAGDHPASCQALLPQLPAANAGTLKLLMQVCSLVHAEAAQNEMDSLALAEVLVPCMAWKPPVKVPQGQGGPGPLQSLAKALTLNKAAGAAAAAGVADAAAEGDAAARGAGDEQQQQHMEEASKVVPLEDAELEAVVTVVDYMISNYSSVFGSSSSSGGSTNGNAAGAVV